MPRWCSTAAVETNARHAACLTSATTRSRPICSSQEGRRIARRRSDGPRGYGLRLPAAKAGRLAGASVVRAAMLLFRFFRIVAPVPALVSGLAAAVLVACAGLALMAPHATSAPLPSLLVLQIFAASSGVVGPARRGYYDTLL